MNPEGSHSMALKPDLKKSEIWNIAMEMEHSVVERNKGARTGNERESWAWNRVEIWAPCGKWISSEHRWVG